ncbi:MAG TPA: hypothetical protein VK960_07765 [Acidimicrobiia bacterium]|nr:hypothetical protein [Acidimicrobiia bacterium]
MRRIVLAVLLAGALVVGTSSAALGHVHGITPLLELGCKVDNSITGANATDGGPADVANGGPISGLIPSGTGSASLGFGDGGFGAANDDVC